MAPSSIGQKTAEIPTQAVFERTSKRAFWLLLAIFELFLLTLPLLPNGDGPVHIYLANILWKLATHSSPLYARYYAVRHLIQPYSFHYYLLILLEHFVTPDTAEKLFAGLIWATLALGFRALTRVLAPHAPAASLLIFPLLFSWPLSAGFFNYTFGSGLLLFAVAFYYTGRLLPFSFVLLLLVFVHPIPLMVLICLVGVDLLLQFPAAKRTQPIRSFPAKQSAFLALACLAFVFPILIADKSAVAGSFQGTHLDPFLPFRMLSGIYITFFQVHSPLGWTYQAATIAILPLTLVFYLRSYLCSRPRKRFFASSTPVDRLLTATFLYLLATFFFPATMNGSALFAVRMWYPVTLLLAAGLPAYLATPTKQRAAAGVALFATAASLLFAFLYLRPIAKQQAALEQAPLPRHARGLFIQARTGGSGVLTHSWWGLRFWDGVRAFTAHDDVLLNTPWLQLTIVPVRENGRAGLLRDLTPNLLSENPAYLPLALAPAMRAPVFALADFLLITDPNGAPPQPLALAGTLLGPLANQWHCTQYGFYAICERR